MAKVIFLIIFLIILLSLFKQFFRYFFKIKLMSSTSLFRGQMTNFGRIRNRLKRINDNFFFLKKISCIFFKNFSDASETFFIYFLQHVSYASEIFSLIFFHLFLTQSDLFYSFIFFKIFFDASKILFSLIFFNLFLTRPKFSFH